METDEQPKDASAGSPQQAKKSRKRLKHTCSKIREQMEFYFSDANLQKDRYLKKLMDETNDGYIDLAVFSNFNKLKALTDDMSIVAKALSNSNLITVSDDKKRIKRSLPLSDPKDTDDRTVYVECLPSSATHDWVKATFAPCGRVVYVSLPKYRSTRDIKGFGFVEFATKEGARKACEMLNNPPAVEGDKLGKFPRANKQMKQLENKLRSHKDQGPGDAKDQRRGRRQRTLSDSAATESRPKQRKRNRTTSMGEDMNPASQADEPELKRFKTADKEADSSSSSSGESDVEESPEVVQKVAENSEKSSRKRKQDSEAEADDKVVSPKKVRIAEEVKVEQVTEVAKKKRKRHRKTKAVKDDGDGKEVPELKVIPKCEWLELRKEYIQYQKSNMKQLKKSLKKLNKPGKEGEKGEERKSESPKEKSRPQIEFTPKVIIKVTSTKELCRKEVKTEASKLGEVAYVDLIDGASEGFIRCHKAEEAAKILEAGTEGSTYSLLEGDEEQSYWEKLKTDREHKLSNKSKPKRRGREKIFKKLEKASEAGVCKTKHVVFDDD